jgi:hypothetical protein
MNEIKRFVKKPIPIQALQYLTENEKEISQFIGDFPHKIIKSDIVNVIIISTLEGDHLVRHGDYVIKGIYDEFYPCKPDIFEDSYTELKDN